MGKPAVYYNPAESPVIVQNPDENYPPIQVDGRSWIVLDKVPREQLDNDTLVKASIPESIDAVGDAAKPVFTEYFAALQKYEDEKNAPAEEAAPVEEAPAPKRSARNSKSVEVGDTASSEKS